MGSHYGLERRNSPRTEISLPVVLSHGSSGQTIGGMVWDVSEGGQCCLLSEPLAADVQDVWLKVEKDGEAFEFEGFLVWREDARKRYGVRLRKPAPKGFNVHSKKQVKDESERRVVHLKRRRINLGGVLFDRRVRSERRRRNLEFFEPSLPLYPYNIPLHREEIYKKIEVRDPYYALQDLVWLDTYTMAAKVKPEQLLSSEVPPISAAEAGRHLAILGSCACSMVNPRPGKHFYLALSAELRRVTDKVFPRDGSFVYLTAKGRILNQKLGQAECTLSTESGELLFTLLVRYTIIPERTFRRTFADKELDMRATQRDPLEDLDPERKRQAIQKRKNPFVKKSEMDNEKIRLNSLETSLKISHPNLCKGHFPFVPAVPVAMLMRDLSGISKKILQMAPKTRDSYFIIQKASVRAQAMSFVDNNLEAHSMVMGSYPESYTLFCESRQFDKQRIGNMFLSLKPISCADLPPSSEDSTNGS